MRVEYHEDEYTNSTNPNGMMIEKLSGSATSVDISNVPGISGNVTIQWVPGSRGISLPFGSTATANGRTLVVNLTPGSAQAI